MHLTDLPQWKILIDHQHLLKNVHMRDLFQCDSKRFEKFHVQTDSWLFDYSKNILTEETLTHLLNLAEACQLSTAIQQLFSGEKYNNTEDRAALHMALRKTADIPNSLQQKINAVFEKISATASKIRNQQWLGATELPITDVVNIGIGGSGLGPLLVCDILKKEHTLPRCHFISNVDGVCLHRLLPTLNPEQTLFIISSKSFTTLETEINANSAKKWLLESMPGKNVDRHLIAITHNLEAATAFGVDEDQVFLIWDFIGGRYSVWSSVGLPIAIALGFEAFTELLEGGAAMDRHFLQAPFSQNIPVLLALISVWYCNFWGASTQAVVPYDARLGLLVPYLQQLQMESNGKGVTREGYPISYMTSPIIWGGVGADGQHAFHQLLHQGMHLVPTDFIISATSSTPFVDHHEALFASCLAQAKALMQGLTSDEVLQELTAAGYTKAQSQALLPHRLLPGNHPSHILMCKALNPHALGALLAMYEHKVFVQSVIWQINPFDQWGVELGKHFAKKILGVLHKPTLGIDDASTAGLIQYYQKIRKVK